MIEVQVENFQSIEKAAFKIDGFTALVGRSNIGKSALVRALRNALTGAPGTDFVRHGASCERRLKDNKKCKCQTTVRIVTSKIELVWEKGDSVNRYTLTRPGEAPVLYDKVDRGTPDFLRPDFAPVKIGDDQDLIQVSEQFNPIFLLNESGPSVAGVLSDVARLDDINEAIRLVSKDRKEASATRTVREKDVADLATSLVAYEGLDVEVAAVRSLEAKHDALQTKQKQVGDLKRFFGELEILARSLRGLQAATKAELPNEDPLQEANRKLLQVTRFHDEWNVRSAAVTRLEGVDAIEMPALVELETAQVRLGKVDGWYRRAQTLKVEFERMRGLSTLKDPNHEAVETARDRFVSADALLGRYTTVVASITTLQAQLEAAEKEEAAALHELQELGLCPTCTQPMGSDRHAHLEAS